MDVLKKCWTCKQVKSLAAFDKSLKSKNSYKRACRSCVQAQPKRTHKTCKHCQRYLAITEFNRNQTKSGGYDCWCKSCRQAYYNDSQYFQQYELAHREQRRQKGKQRYATNGPLIRSAIQCNRAGISVTDYRQLLAKQNGKCAICGSESGGIRYGKPSALSLDHDHTSGHIRGLLCANCNFALGLFRDSIPNLQAAVQYLTKPPCDMVVKWHKNTRTLEAKDGTPPRPELPADRQQAGVPPG